MGKFAKDHSVRSENYVFLGHNTAKGKYNIIYKIPTLNCTPHLPCSCIKTADRLHINAWYVGIFMHAMHAMLVLLHAFILHTHLTL